MTKHINIAELQKLKQKAKDAFNNAKQRCTNPNNPSYPGYGGKGIKFLLESPDQMVAEIGLPKKGEQIDRINAHGHYAPGNIRWVNKYLQAANKYGMPGASYSSIEDDAEKYQSLVALSAASASAGAAWTLFLDALRRGYFRPTDGEWLQDNPVSPEALEAGWDLWQAWDSAEPPSFFRMPSLSWPGKAVTLPGGPFECSKGPGPKDISAKYGTLRYFGRSAEFIPEGIRLWLTEDLGDPGKAGAAWIFNPSPADLASGGVEGWMLMAASRLLHRPNAPVAAAIFPVRTVLRKMDELGGPWNWPSESAPVLRATALFIPDFQIDVVQDQGPSAFEYGKLAKLLRYRREQGLKTFVGIQNHHKLPEVTKYETMGRLKVRTPMSAVKWPKPIPLIPAQTKVSFWSPSEKRWGFQQVRELLFPPKGDD